MQKKKTTKTTKAKVNATEQIIKKSVEHCQAREFAVAYNLLKTSSEVAKPREKNILLRALYDLSSKRNPDIALQALDAMIGNDPKASVPWLLKARLFEGGREVKKTVDACLEVLKLKSTNQELVEVARMLSRFGDQKNAMLAAKRAYLDSNEDVSLATYPLRVCLQNADWDTTDKICQTLKEAHHAGRSGEIGETPRTHLLWCADEEVNYAVIQNFGKKNVKDVNQVLAKSIEGDYKRRKVRIGYLSNDFRDHPTSFLALGLLRHHNTDRFDIYLYDTSYDDNSVTRREILSRAKYARSLSKLNDAQAASVIFKDKIDILVDLNGLTEGNRLGIFNYRPAPVQISYLGFPGSTGHSMTDYIIADDYTIPKGSEQYYQESIIRIPVTYQVNDYIAQYLPPKPSRSKYGLPEGKVIIGMFNNINKVGREVWSTWMRVMKETPDSVLWMLSPGDIAKENLMAHAKANGISADRFFWAKKVKPEKHLARLQLCALSFDPWPYGGHTTTSDAIFAGVPVVALKGTNFPSRVSGGLLEASGLKSLVCENIEKYIETCIKLINDTQLRRKIKAHLIKNRRQLPIFDIVNRTLYIETAYLHACDLVMKGLPHSSFNIKNRQKQLEKAE